VIGVISGFAIIATIILAGWVVARIGLLGERADHVLSRLSYFVLTPALLLTVLAQSEPGVLFSALVPISMIAAVSCFIIAILIARFVWRRGVPETTITALASGYVNANNVGLPIALYVLGDATLAAPVILVNLMIYAPIALAVLDASTSGHTSWSRILLQPVRNPIIIAAAIGLLLATFAIPVPDIVLEPFRLIGGAAVPVLLLLFGMSLNGARVLTPGSGRRDVVLATLLKSVVMPLIAWAVGSLAFDLSPESLFAVVVLAGLPSAQHVYAWAHRFERHTAVARDTVLISTVALLPVMIAVSGFLAPTS
jgi:predicted permease